MSISFLARLRKSRAIAALLALLMVAAVACAEDDGGESTDDDTSSGETSVNSEDSEAATAHGLEFTGGTEGEASGDPYRVGFAHSSEFFPEGDTGAEAAVKWINAELGGVGGRPIELVPCSISTPEDAASCGAEFANDESIDLVIGGFILYAPSDFYAALAGKAAAMIAAPLDVSDYSNPNAVAYTTGALGAGIGGAEYVATALKPKTNALIATDDVAGRGGAAVLTPINEAYGIELKTVFVSPTATAPEIASALQAAGAEDADVISVGLFEQGCIAAYDALESVGLADREVITTNVCAGNAMQQHLKDVGAEFDFPNGWTFVGSTIYTPEPSEDLSAYLAKFPEYGDEAVMSSVPAPLTFAAVLNAAKILNASDVDSATFDTLEAAVRGFTGPAFLQPGPIECGNPPYISICASEVPVDKFQDGEWENVDPGVDISKYLNPGG
jgi:branched-chain amino acid transport system substrate-binding protein